MALVVMIGFALLAFGIWLQVKVQKREFERRNASGVMEFENFGQSYKFTLQNRALKGGSVVLFVVGALMFAFGLVAGFN